MGFVITLRFYGSLVNKDWSTLINKVYSTETRLYNDVISIFIHTDYFREFQVNLKKKD